MWREVREGLRFTFRTPEVRIATLLVGALLLTIVNFQTLVPLFARPPDGSSFGGLGVLLSSLGVGSAEARGVVKAWVSTWRSRWSADHDQKKQQNALDRT